jgi:hypothetical protein
LVNFGIANHDIVVKTWYIGTIHMGQKLLRKSIATLALSTLLVALWPIAVISAETVTVGNQAPSFLRPPSRHETTGHQETAGRYTYKAYGYDQNGDDYYMLVCTSAEGASGTYPAGCTGDTICSSITTASDTIAHCSLATEDEVNAETLSGDWYVVLCDTNPANQACSQPWNGALPAEEQESSGNFESPVTIVQLASTSQSTPPTVEEITYNTLLLLLLCGAAIAVPLLILSVREKKQSERLTVSVSLFILVFTSFFGLAATWPEEHISRDTQVLGERAPSTPLSTTRYPYAPAQDGMYPIYLEANINSPIIYEAHEEERFTVVEHQPYWVNVFLPEGGSGWVPVSSIK